MERSALSVARVGRAAWPREAWAGCAWVAVIAIASAWGAALRDEGARIALGAAPLFGSFDLAVEPGIVAAVVVAAVVIWAWPRLADRLRWRGLVAVGALAALAWSITLALGHGIAGINEPLEGPSDYLVSVPLIHSPGDFLATFTERIDAYSTHVRSHPPGMALLLYGLDRAGLAAPGRRAR
jgi:hypothetical protein